MKPMPIQATVEAIMAHEERRHMHARAEPPALAALIEEIDDWLEHCGVPRKVLALAAGVSRTTMYNPLSHMNVASLLRLDAIRCAGLGPDEIAAIADKHAALQSARRRAIADDGRNGRARTRRDGPVAVAEEAR